MSTIAAAGGNEPRQLNRTFRSLAEVDPNDTPLVDWEDPCPEIVYESPQAQPRCLLCKSHLRKELEHVYFGNKKNYMAVVRHLQDRWGVRYSWDAVKQHMDNHVYFDSVGTSGIGEIVGAMHDQRPIEWMTLDICYHGTLQQIDRVKGAPTQRNFKSEERKASLLSKLFRDLEYFHEKRASMRTNIIDVGQVLKELYDALTDVQSKRIVAQKLAEIDAQIKTAAEGR
jgi:hypothetical protein